MPIRTYAIFGLLALAACGGGMTTGRDTVAALPSLTDVAPEQWDALARRRIFFGHQSVGDNIMAGVADIMATHAQIRLNVLQSRDLRNASVPAFVHAPVGRNDYPIEKFDDFIGIAAQGFATGDGVAMVKLCYTDVHRDTDPNALLEEYRKRVDSLRRQNPALTIVHFTMPLTVIENWKGRLMATLKGLATQRERNVIRNRYNDLLRRTYAGKEPVFDIAALESTLPDGRRVYFGSDEHPVYMLAPEYTHDGSHLNERARRRVAEQLLIMLARLESTRMAAAR